MRLITFREFLAATGLTVPKIKVMRQRDQIALAFGRREAFEKLDYIELDAAAALLADELMIVFDRGLAAWIVRLHCSIWARVVAIADATNEPAFFSVVEFELEGQLTHRAAGGTSGNTQEIIREVSKETPGWTPVRAVAVNMSRILQRARDNARRKGCDLSEPFLPAPNDPQLDLLLKPYETLVDEAVAAYAKMVKAGEAQLEAARRAGIVARANVEASLPA
jgi:hypothetical protein